MSGFTHGTNYGYNVKRCRCDDCRGWYSASRAARYAADPDYYRKRHAVVRARKARQREERRARLDAREAAP